MRRWVGHVDAKVMELYTHMTDDTAQATMQRRLEAKSSLQVTNGSQDGKESGSAQT